jgi:hypothetical protein
VSAETRTRLKTVAAPYGREVWLDEVRFESGMRLLRTTIKEGRRFTQLDLDAETAGRWGQAMLDWARRANGEGPR